MAEFVPLVSRKNRLVGRTTRARVHQIGKRHRAIHVILFHRDGRVWVQKRAAGKDTFPGWWEASVSGHQHSNENSHSAARRELREELGIKRRLLKRADSFITRRPELLYAALYIVKGFVGRPRLQKREVSAGRFVKINEFKRLLRQRKFTPATRAAVKLSGLLS